MSFGVDPTGKTQSGVQLPSRSVPGARAEGLASKARVPGSHAEGDGSLAVADGAHAEGVGAVAVGDGSHAQNNSTATANHGHAEGDLCIAGNTPRPFTVSGTTVTIQGTVTDEFNDGGSNPKVARFYNLVGGAHNTLHSADKNIGSPVVNQTGSLVAYVAQGSGTNPAHLYTLNLSTGLETLVGTLLCQGLNVSITGMAMDPTTGIMYAVSGGASPNFPVALFTVNLANAQLTLIGFMTFIFGVLPFTLGSGAGAPCPDISFDMHGNLWGTCINNPHFPIICSIDKTNGERLVTQTDRQLNGTQGMGFAFMNKAQRAFILSQDNSPLLRLTELNPVGWATVNQLTVTGPAAGVIIGSCFFDQSNTLYAVSNQGGVFAYYTIDIVTGVSTLVHALTRDYDASALAVAYNTTFTIDSVLDDRTSGMAVHPTDGDGDHAEGFQCQAKGGDSHAEGNFCTAIGNAAHAEGHLSVANSNAVPTNGFGSHAEGKSVALAPFSHTEGQGAFAFVEEGHAEGLNTASRATAAHAEGLETVAHGNWSHAEGGTSVAYGDSSHAEGGSNQVNSEGGHVEGENNQLGNVRRAFTVSGTVVTIAGGDFTPTGTGEFSNGSTIRFADLLGGTNQKLFYTSETISGVTFNVGPNTTTFNIGSALDDRTSGVCFDQSVAITAHAEGSLNTTAGQNSHVEGNQNSINVNGFAAHAEGTGNTATNLASHVEGDSCGSNNFASHAEGNSTIANGNGSHAEGSGAQANGTASHAEGQSTFANGDQSHAEGSGSRTGNLARNCTISGTTITFLGIDVTSEFNNGDAVRFVNLTGGTQDVLFVQDRLVSSVPLFSGGNTTFLINSGIGDRTGGQCFDTAFGSNAHAEGNSTATSQYSHSEGLATLASAQSAHAEGGQTTASGGQSHAEGSNSVASGTQAHAEGDTTTASGDNSHAEGNRATASGTNSHAQGFFSLARLADQDAIASGIFAAAGDAQATKIVLRKKTTDATPTQLFIDNVSAQLTIPINTTFAYRIDVVARQTGAVDTCAAFYLTGFITSQGTVGSTRLNAGATNSVLDAGSGTWTVVASADTGTGALKITVTGQNAKNINWVATVWLTETAG